jgi:hypothetical protein
MNLSKVTSVLAVAADGAPALGVMNVAKHLVFETLRAKIEKSPLITIAEFLTISLPRPAMKVTFPKAPSCIEYALVYNANDGFMVVEVEALGSTTEDAETARAVGVVEGAT